MMIKTKSQMKFFAKTLSGANKSYGLLEFATQAILFEIEYYF